MEKEYKVISKDLNVDSNAPTIAPTKDFIIDKELSQRDDADDILFLRDKCIDTEITAAGILKKCMRINRSGNKYTAQYYFYNDVVDVTIYDIDRYCVFAEALFLNETHYNVFEDLHNKLNEFIK